MRFSTIDRPAVGLTYLPRAQQLVLFVLSHMAEHRGCEADCQLPYSTEVKSMWNYTSVFHTSSWCGAMLGTRTVQINAL